MKRGKNGASTKKVEGFCQEILSYASDDLYEWVEKKHRIYRERVDDLDTPSYYARTAAPVVLQHLYKFDPVGAFEDLLRMGCECYCTTTLSPTIALAKIAYYEQPLTCRSGFYRAVSSGVYRDTSEQFYRKSNNALLKLRRTGIVPYEFIVDGTRHTDKPSSWSGLTDYLETVASSYRCDLWQRQQDYIEVFVEKDAMAGVLSPVTRVYDVRLNIIRGACSESFAWQIAEHWKKIEKPIYAYYIGDHDPAGLSIEQDLRNRLDLLSEGVPVTWQRLAVTDTDFRRSDLIGFPVKPTIKVATRLEYIRKYGNRCVECDAIPSTEMRARLKATIESHINQEEWRKLQHQERLERRTFQDLVLAQKQMVEERAG